MGFLAYSCNKIQILQQFKYLESPLAIPKIVDTVLCTKVIWGRYSGRLKEALRAATAAFIAYCFVIINKL